MNLALNIWLATTVLDSAILHQDIRKKDDLLRASRSSTNLANTQIILMEF